ncbi:carbohydrate ABC transporter permease [Evansella tamaricis]|uniref:Carbohydrate ABC transporter permease n=1 Tax=Evansella tamaricis TaxID=2069301 RepID=A0ABS6JH10_9BACI|nr:carbohydrate ABC transporter permease [Evansella tamaricis]MBU9711623.1 carbohydrate ABC transporter permease [Evansella tamaricis]
MDNRKSKRASIIYHTFIIGFGLLMLYPILWMAVSSLKPEHEIFLNSASLIPSEIKWENYVQGWSGFGKYGFDLFFKNSMIVTSLSVVGALFSSSLVAFAFARLKFKFQGALFACLLATVMLPMQVTLIPQYILFHNLNWVNTFLPLVVPAFIGGSPFFIFLMVQFIRGIPRELDEAAIIDGCSWYGVFWYIILPLCKPALVTVMIFQFMWTWDDFLSPLIYLQDTNLYTMALGLRAFSDPDNLTAWGPLIAMSTVSLIPQFILFLFCQKYLVKGIATTGIK